MKIGIIGAGWWASHAYIPRLMSHPDVEEISVCRPDQAGLEILAEKFGIRHCFDNAEALLERHRPDGVIVASPHDLHFGHAMMCIERRLPVLIEKPMTSSAAEARLLVEAQQRHQSPVMVAYGWNHSPLALAAKRLLAEHGIGRLEHATCVTASPTYELFSGDVPAATAGHLFQPAPSTWSNSARAGGYAWGQLTHALGLFFLLVDQAPKGVLARASLSHVGVDMSNAAIVELSEGAFVCVSGTGMYPKGPRKLLEIRLYGTDGLLSLNMETDSLQLDFFDDRPPIEVFDPGAGDYSIENMLETFIECCQGINKTIKNDCIIGARAVNVIEHLHKSTSN